MKILATLALVFFCICSSFQAFSQANYVRTAMPFLHIAPDAKASSMGETGVATTPDLSNIYWNNAKLAFLGGDYGGSASYTPWLSQLKSGITSMYFTGFRKFDDSQAIGLSINYFTLGTVKFYDEVGNDIGKYNPNEFSIEVAYAKQLSENMSLGITGKFLHSDLGTGQNVGSVGITPASTAAFDFGWYYEHPMQNDARISFGAFLSNIGPKIKQSTGSNGQYLPMNLRLGTQVHLEGYENGINFSLDINKLLVPTPPVYLKDSSGSNTNVILRGSDPNRSIPAAIFGSFGDAPGGFSQQIKQFTVGVGAEYGIQHKFFLRTGYHYENASLGDSRYVTAGLGYTGPSLRLDFSYIVPFGQYNPYKGTFRITIGVNIVQ